MFVISYSLLEHEDISMFYIVLVMFVFRLSIVCQHYLINIIWHMKFFCITITIFAHNPMIQHQSSWTQETIAYSVDTDVHQHHIPIALPCCYFYSWCIGQPNFLQSAFVRPCFHILYKIKPSIDHGEVLCLTI